MGKQLLGIAVVASLAGCESKKAVPELAPTAAPTAGSSASQAPLIDLTATTSLAAVRTEFNAHKGEVRFLTLLSPT